MKLNLVLKLTNNIKIFTNQLNWVLDYGNKNERFYYSSLDELFDDLLEIRLVKKLTIKRKTLTNISKLSDEIKDTRKSIREDIERFKNLMSKADTARRKGVFNV